MDKQLRNILTAINMIQEPKGINTTLEIIYRYVDSYGRLTTRYKILEWVNHRPSEPEYYSNVQVLKGELANKLHSLQLAN